MQLNSSKRGWLSVLALFVAVLALVAAGCGGDDDEAGDGATTEATGGGGGGVEALPSSSCTAVEYEGEGEPDVLIASDFPLQGSSRTQTIQIVEAIRYLLEQSNFKAGDHNVAYQSCDDATAQDRKSTRLNSSHGYISYAVFCLKKKNHHEVYSA